MTLFPIIRPRLGLSISMDAACLVEIHSTVKGKTFRKLAHHPLPDGLIQLSPAKPNISDPNTLSEVLGKLTKGYKKPRTIVLSLPDVCGRTALFEFNSFPKKTADREAILSWRFQQDLNLPTKNARIGYRLYKLKKQNKANPAQGPAVTRVLATAVPNQVIEQYELACLKAGLLPLDVGLSSLDVFDLFGSMAQKKAESASRRSQRSGQDSLFLYLSGWGFSFIAHRDGCPAFVRVKYLRLAQRKDSSNPMEPTSLALQNSETSGNSQQSEPSLPPTLESVTQSSATSHTTNPPSGIARMFTNELVATLQYYLESFQTTAWTGQTLPLYVAEGNEQVGAFLSAIQEIESMLKASMGHSPNIALLRFSDHLKTVLHTGDKLNPHTYQKGLPAYASVMVAS